MGKGKKVQLKPGKEKPLLQRHHWIFSGAIAHLPPFGDGELLNVESHEGEVLGVAYFNRRSNIIGRMISFGKEDPYQTLEQNIENAIFLRRTLIPTDTTCFRLINGEGDFLPGLTVDQYGEFLVIQVSTLGIEKLKPFILTSLRKKLSPKGILEKSNQPSRKEEGLLPFEGLLFGEFPEKIYVGENGLKFKIDPKNAQKTGFFLDQREMRKEIRELASGKTVLNCFSYTGGFSVYALAGGAKSVHSIDISKEALEQAKENASLNGYEGPHLQFTPIDVFQFLRDSDLQNYDLVILDPPAFAKKAKDRLPACRGYKEINRMAIKKMPPSSLLITSSCSYFIDEKLFQQLIFQAAHEAGRKVQILSRHRQAIDHPINIFHKEGEYLKSLVLFIGE